LLRVLFFFFFFFFFFCYRTRAPLPRLHLPAGSLVLPVMSNVLVLFSCLWYNGIYLLCRSSFCSFGSRYFPSGGGGGPGR
jgi:hypothetical protein